MDDFQKIQRKASVVLLASFWAIIASSLGIWWFASERLNLSDEQAVGLTIGGVFILSIVTSRAVSRYILSPLHTLWQAILHVAPESNTVAAPNMDKLHFGQKLVTSLTARVYQFASQEDGIALAEHRKSVLQAVNIVSHFPLPVFVFNKQLVVTNASDSALAYLELQSPQLFGQRLFDSVNLEFPSDYTLENWIEECQTSKVTDQAYWQRVHVRLRDGQTIKQCDIAAYYNRENESGTEFIVTLFDHTDLYNQDDQSLGFVALAVHELRTPLTMLRGYIEVLEEELAGKIDNELENYVHKLRVSADQLADFVNNILNVVKIEQNQLSLSLVEQTWAPVLQEAATNMRLRAETMGKNITFNIDKNLPTVAIDPVSISAVVSNLLDNAIKYSRDSKQIVVTCRVNQEGVVETTVQDFGVGIPESVLPNLFEKFYRNHRTRNQIGGTGLGLYLSKAIIDAHGGHIWVRSKPGEGSSFSFTLQPYAQLADELKKQQDNSEITRHAHGWIKNHSLYRR